MLETSNPSSRQWAFADGGWWVLLVTDGFTIEFPPEVYRELDDAQREAERWAWVLSRRSGIPVEHPFESRWEVGDEWIRLTSSVLPEAAREIWVGTYWGRDGVPEPEAALFPDGNEARAWVREPAAGAVLVEYGETAWSAFARFRVHGGEEEAEAHRAKVIPAVAERPEVGVPGAFLYGFELSEGLIPQGPQLFATEAARDEALRVLLAQMLNDHRWRGFVLATAQGNYVEKELPVGWAEQWDATRAVDWLLGFDFIADGDRMEIRRFEATL